MSLKESLKTQLAATPNFTSGEHGLAADDGPHHLECRLLALEPLACAFTSFTLSCQKLSAMTSEELKRVAESLAGRVTYLLEPISPIETDAEGCTVQMRSNPPQKEADRTSYYELLVSRAGTLSLCRWTREAKAVRQPVPAQVTREVLLRLADDFAAVV
jgi:hypothetical protein